MLKIIAMLLWSITAYLAGYQVFLVRHMVSVWYLRLLNAISTPINVLERLSATGLGNIASVFMALLALVIVVGGWDYHWSYGGEWRSFKLLGWTLLFEFLILGLYIAT